MQPHRQSFWLWPPRLPAVGCVKGQEEVSTLRSIWESERDWSVELYSAIEEVCKPMQSSRFWSLLCASRKAVSEGVRRSGRRLQHQLVRPIPPYLLTYPYRTGMRLWEWCTKWKRRDLREQSCQDQRDQPFVTKPVLRPVLKRNNGELWTLLIPCSAEGKHLFADWNLFSGKFAASLGPRLGMSPQDWRALLSLQNTVHFCSLTWIQMMSHQKVWGQLKRDFRGLGRTLTNLGSPGSIFLYPPCNRGTLQKKLLGEPRMSKPGSRAGVSAKTFGFLSHGRAFKRQGVGVWRDPYLSMGKMGLWVYDGEAQYFCASM